MNGQINAVEKTLIKTASNPFKTMLESFKEGRDCVIQFMNETIDTITAFVNFIQYGDIVEDMQTLCTLSVFLDKYMVPQDTIMT
jgi:hypothetical protein